MNSPLARASCRNFCATSFRCENGSVLPMMNWIGRPWLPGSGGGWNATTCAPAIFAMFCCTSGCNCAVVRVR